MSDGHGSDTLSESSEPERIGKGREKREDSAERSDPGDSPSRPDFWDDMDPIVPIEKLGDRLGSVQEMESADLFFLPEHQFHVDDETSGNEDTSTASESASDTKADAKARDCDPHIDSVIDKDKKRRNREAAIRFRKNRKDRDKTRESTLSDMREREAEWRLSEKDWRAREEEWQTEKLQMQSHLEFYKELFTKQNMSKMSTVAMSGLALSLAAICVAMPMQPSTHMHQGFQSSPTGRALLGVADSEDGSWELHPQFVGIGTLLFSLVAVTRSWF